MSDIYAKNYFKIAAAVVLPNVGGYLGSKITRDNLKPWYAALNKPKWNPPNYVFAPVWTSIYTGIGYASYLVYRDLVAAGTGFDHTAKIALALYVNQMTLNWAWTPIFFKLHSLKWSVVEISALTVSAAACGCAFGHINRIAGLIFVPYVLWLSFATYLNYTIYKINPDKEEANITEIKNK